MKQFISLAFGSGAFIVLVLSCHKSVSDNPLQQTTDSTTSVQQVPVPHELQTQCDSGPDYGDSIVYQQPTTGSDYFISPVNNPGSGQFLSWPQGLVIDPSTGTINISKSGAGQRYLVGFIKTGSKDTCVRKLIVGGTSYIDSVYDLNASNYSATPYYNANPNTPSPCDGSSGTGSGCKFVSRYKILGKELTLDEKTGVINLQKTFINGIFGPLPFNGETVIATIDYTLDDNSNGAQQTMQLKFIYYNRRFDIPSHVLDDLTHSRESIESDDAGSGTTNLRPPLIIITRNK